LERNFGGHFKPRSQDSGAIPKPSKSKSWRPERELKTFSNQLGPKLLAHSCGLIRLWNARSVSRDEASSLATSISCLPQIPYHAASLENLDISAALPVSYQDPRPRITCACVGDATAKGATNILDIRAIKARATTAHCNRSGAWLEGFDHSDHSFTPQSSSDSLIRCTVQAADILLSLPNRRCDHVQTERKEKIAKGGRRVNSGRATGQLHTIYEVVEKGRFLQATWVFAKVASPHVKRLVRHQTVEARDLA
jgi:hypothetical protein